MTTQFITTQLLLQINTALGLAAIAFTVGFSLNQYAHQRVAASIPVKVHDDKSA